jgi:hypothetical protein
MEISAFCRGNRDMNQVCGGNGPMGCKTPKPKGAAGAAGAGTKGGSTEFEHGNWGFPGFSMEFTVWKMGIQHEI